MKDVSEQKKKSAPEAKGATAVRKFHTHSIPLDMEDIARDWEKPVVDAGIAAKASVIVRVGMLDLGAGTGSFRVREMMHRIAYPLGVHVRADVNLTDIEATCTDGRNRITEVVDLPSTGVNTERIWLLEHFADWFSVNLGKGSMYHVDSQLSDGVVKHLDERDASQYSADLAKRLRERAKVEAEAANGSVDEALDLASKTKVLVTSVAKSLDDDNEEAHRLLADSAEVTPVEDKAAEEKAYDDAEVFTGDSNESVESANAANGATAESPAASSTKRKNRVPKEYAEHFNERSDEEKAKGGITVRQAHERLDLIERRKPLYKPWFSGLASALACAAFVFLLGGGPYDMIGAFVGAGLGQWMRRRLFAYHLNQFFVTFVCVAAAALACTGTLRLIGIFDPVALSHDTAYIGAMLFVIPGFPLITGGLDMAKIDFPSGIQRVAYVLCIILMATLAGWAVAVMVHLHPEGFEPLGLDPWVNGLLRFVLRAVQFAAAHVPDRRPDRCDHGHAALGIARLQRGTRDGYLHRRVSGGHSGIGVAFIRATWLATAAPRLPAHLPDRAVDRDHGARSVYVSCHVVPRQLPDHECAGLGVPCVHGDYLSADRLGDGPRGDRQVLALRHLTVILALLRWGELG